MDKDNKIKDYSVYRKIVLDNKKSEYYSRELEKLKKAKEILDILESLDINIKSILNKVDRAIEILKLKIRFEQDTAIHHYTLRRVEDAKQIRNLPTHRYIKMGCDYKDISPISDKELGKQLLEFKNNGRSNKEDN